MALHKCETPIIRPGKRTFKEGSEWKCKSHGCGQVWVAQPLSRAFKLLVWKRK